MAIGRRRRAPQQELFVAASDIRALDNPFYRALNGLLEEHGFDEFAEEQCAEFYSGNRGRPGVPPGVYFRMLMVGYLEGLGSERGIAWRCADSFSLREFLGCGLAGNPPEHSTLSKTRKRLSVEAHGAVFGFVLERLRESGLLSGRTLGVDATTLEANAAMRTIVRRDDGTEYEEWLEQLAAASGIETPTREDLAKLDRKRPNKGSNKDWEHPHDPEARITKMKDGRTRLAHKLEQAVDMETGAVVAATVQTMDGGDTASLAVTLDEAEERLAEVGVEAKEVVADKGYHSNRTMTEVKERGKRSYVSEPNRGRRRWKGKRDAQKAVYANRRRIRGDRGKRLLRRRGEKVERAFAHMLETGGMRRVHVRGQEEIRKRMLVQAAAFNLGLLMRRRCGFGTPRALQGLAWAQAELAARAADAASAFIRRSKAVFRLLSAISAVTAANPGRRRPNPPFLHNPARLYTAFATHKRRSADALYPRPARGSWRKLVVASGCCDFQGWLLRHVIPIVFRFDERDVYDVDLVDYHLLSAGERHHGHGESPAPRPQHQGELPGAARPERDRGGKGARCRPSHPLACSERPCSHLSGDGDSPGKGGVVQRGVLAAQAGHLRSRPGTETGTPNKGRSVRAASGGIWLRCRSPQPPMRMLHVLHRGADDGRSRGK